MSAGSCLAQTRCLAGRRLNRRRLVPANGGPTPGPGPENVSGRIDVPIVRLTTVRTFPTPYSKLPETAGTTESSTARTASRGVSLVDDLYGSAGALALVLQESFEQAPARIEHGFRHPRLGQLQATHVAHDNLLIGIHHPAAELVAGILPTTSDSSMHPLSLPHMATSLQGADPKLRISIKPDRFQALPVARHGDILEPEINTHRRLRRGCLLIAHIHRQAQPPVSDRILRKAALLPAYPLQALTLKYPQGLAAEAQRAALALEARRLERDPPEAAAGSATDPPAQLQAPVCHALLRVLHANALDGGRADALEIRGRAGREGAQVVAGKPFAFAIRTGGRGERNLIAVIEHTVHFDGTDMGPFSNSSIRLVRPKPAIEGPSGVSCLAQRGRDRDIQKLPKTFRNAAFAAHREKSVSQRAGTSGAHPYQLLLTGTRAPCIAELGGGSSTSVLLNGVGQ